MHIMSPARVLFLLFLLGGIVALIMSKPHKTIELENQFIHGGKAISASLYIPQGEGPFPAVVLLHGCAGVMEKHRVWAEELVDWGYLVLIPDSFGSRGINRLCEADDTVWQRYNELRPYDITAALWYLNSIEQVDANRVGLIGWSYGGTIVLRMLDEAFPLSKGMISVKAGISLYPGCWQYMKYIATKTTYSSHAPLLILQGGSDDWTLPENCIKFVNSAKKSSHPVKIRIYPGAFHDFDNGEQRITKVHGVRLELPGKSGDVTVGYDKSIHDLARFDVKDFLRLHLN